MKNRGWMFGFFGAAGLNLVLLGLWVGSPSGQDAASLESAGSRAPAVPSPAQQASDAVPAVVPGTRMRGPRDLRLLHEMERVMGGKEDPRVIHLGEGSAEKIAQERIAVGRAHRKVLRVLTSKSFDFEELQAALSVFREKRSSVQELTQVSIANLGELLTAEERGKIRHLARR